MGKAHDGRAPVPGFGKQNEQRGAVRMPDNECLAEEQTRVQESVVADKRVKCTQMR